MQWGSPTRGMALKLPFMFGGGVLLVPSPQDDRRR